MWWSKWLFSTTCYRHSSLFPLRSTWFTFATISKTGGTGGSKLLSSGITIKKSSLIWTKSIKWTWRFEQLDHSISFCRKMGCKLRMGMLSNYQALLNTISFLQVTKTRIKKWFAFLRAKLDKLTKIRQDMDTFHGSCRIFLYLRGICSIDKPVTLNDWQNKDACSFLWTSIIAV